MKLNGESAGCLVTQESSIMVKLIISSFHPLQHANLLQVYLILANRIWKLGTNQIDLKEFC